MRTTISRQYSDSASRAGDAVEKAINLWTRGVRQVTDRARVRLKLPQVDLVPSVERYFDFVRRTLEDNRGILGRKRPGGTPPLAGHRHPG